MASDPFSGESLFTHGVVDRHFPPCSCPEVAFFGRSNVGKSSLINALIRRKSLVRTSRLPGHTRQFNFFNVGKHLTLVDTPGYGYARVSHTHKEAWHTLRHTYIRNRSQYNKVFAVVVVDIRRSVGALDAELITLLESYGMPYSVVFTKIDTLHLTKLPSLTAPLGIFYVSATKKKGIHTLRQALTHLITKANSI